MTQIGEAIAPPEFVPDDKHDENTCPWHSEEKSKKPDVMEAQNPDEDSKAMPPNNGGTLGRNMDKQENGAVWVQYKAGALLKFEVGVKEKKKKVVQSYEHDEEWLYCYDLKYAPHHLIPGNESLKGSKIVAYLGDDDVIKNFKKSISSKVKKGQSIGYDVNSKTNGVWLPAPYALSMCNDWPSIPGIDVIKKRLGNTYANETEAFKHAYVAEAIRVSRGRQFHMRHTDYSKMIRDTLDKMGAKLKLMAGGECPIAPDTNEDDKFDAPTGLVSRLNLLSRNLKRFLTGPVWREPLFSDDKLMFEYIKSLKKIPGLKGKADKIL